MNTILAGILQGVGQAGEAWIILDHLEVPGERNLFDRRTNTGSDLLEELLWLHAVSSGFV